MLSVLKALKAEHTAPLTIDGHALATALGKDLGIMLTKLIKVFSSTKHFALEIVLDQNLNQD